MSGRVRTLTAAVASLVLAAVLALLANDLRSWRDALREGDARYLASPASEGLWEVDTALPSGASRRLLGLDDDLAYRAAVRMFRLGRTRDPAFGREILPAYRAHAETQLSEIARADRDRTRRSAALNLVGILTLSRLRSDPARADGILRESLSAFRTAIEIDSANTDAKANLELVLRLRADRQRRQRQERERRGPAADARRGGLTGAGSGY